MEKIIVDKDQCIGCGMCIQNNPEYFIFSDDGFAEAINIEVKNEDKKEILNRIDECPGQAIHIEETQNNEIANNNQSTVENNNGIENSKCEITIDATSCIGCGMCAGSCPEYFALNEEGFAKIVKNNVETEDKDEVTDTANNCPGSAITVNEK